MEKGRKRVLVAGGLAALALAGLAAAFAGGGDSGESGAYRTARLDRGAIVASVAATGTVNPTTTVLVGAQVSGRVVELLADFNTPVKAGQVVARLDSDQTRARLDAARAELAQTKAELQIRQAQMDRTRADIDRARAASADARAQLARADALMTDADRSFERQRDLQTRGVAATANVDTARANAQATRAQRDSARAQIDSAAAQIAGLQADLKLAEAQIVATQAAIDARAAIVRQVEVDVDRTEIRAPVDGVVVQRTVELGQSVAASLQAPTLFTIAADLRAIEIYANVDEGDVGRLRAGQAVSFTVNAYPGRNFTGEVKQVRLGSQTVQNVVIYTAVVAAANADMALLPGMTTTLRVFTDRRDDVLRAPAAALRWRPAGVSASGAPADAPNPLQTVVERAQAEFAAQIRSDVKPTAEQQRQIDRILEELRAEIGKIAAIDLPPDQRRQRFASLRQGAGERIAGLLTPEQRPAFDEIRRRTAAAGRGGQGGATGRLWVIGADGRPEAMTVRLGASDGNFTEVSGSGLAAGREIVVGGGPRAGAAGGTSGGPFGFRLF